jgi:molybdenum cofactor cytidylyltransferase
MKTGAIILAAGFSRRFGGVKLSAVLPHGSTVLQQSVRVISQGVSDLIIVTRQELLEQGMLQDIATGEPQQHIVICHDSAAGMGHSLAQGAKQIPEDWDACLVCLADMPFISSETILKLSAVARRDTIVCPVLSGRRGHPVCFGRQFFAELTRAHGDSGGRQIMNQNSQHVQELEIHDEGILQDIDTPSDMPACQH